MAQQASKTINSKNSKIVAQISQGTCSLFFVVFFFFQVSSSETNMDKYERVKLLGRGSFGKAWLIKESTSSKLLVAKDIRIENKHVRV